MPSTRDKTTPPVHQRKVRAKPQPPALLHWFEKTAQTFLFETCAARFLLRLPELKSRVGDQSRFLLFAFHLSSNTPHFSFRGGEGTDGTGSVSTNLVVHGAALVPQVGELTDMPIAS